MRQSAGCCGNGLWCGKKSVMTLREFASNNSTNNRASRLFVCCRQKRKRKDDTSGLNRFLIFLNGKLTLLFRYKQGPAFIFPGWRVVFVQGAKVASGPVSYTSILTWTMTTKMLREHVITNAELNRFKRNKTKEKKLWGTVWWEFEYRAGESVQQPAQLDSNDKSCSSSRLCLIQTILDK